MFMMKSVTLIAFLVFLVNIVSASMEKHVTGQSNAAVRLEKRVGQDCLQCAESYVDCFARFGLAGCTDPSAEHFTYCRNCYGSNPAW
ncbi:hypothetical protein MYAM1_003716 [Malassezia yamatoensis]|uniref:Uncharacterized protein n=1 Tax=Malassezia yamatoensis TaxID=253288 RepID=A0AAJ5Z261_9BASI|nr:hypothetical protein MYAM1_003716 [Malassezia yamatoensis]